MLAVCGLLATILLVVVVGPLNLTQSPAGEDLRATAGRDGPQRDAPDFLCGAEGQRYLSSQNDDSNSGVAMDRGGRFALYGAADSSGRPTRDSFEILRGCDPNLSFNNYATLRVGDGPPEPAGLSNLLSPTAVSKDGSRATTRYEFAPDVTMTQRATMEDGGLLLSYELGNTSEANRTLTFRSLLTPAVAPPKRDVLFEARRSPGSRITEVAQERTLHLDDGRVESISAPRPAAASGSSATWRPQGGRVPDRITFAGFLDLSSSPMLYDVRLAWDLPPHSAMALYWTGLQLSAGESVEFSYRYELAGRAQP